MTVTLYQKQVGEYTCEVAQEKYCKTYKAAIYYKEHTVYKNYFSTIDNAKRALSRNLKKYL